MCQIFEFQIPKKFFFRFAKPINNASICKSAIRRSLSENDTVNREQEEQQNSINTTSITIGNYRYCNSNSSLIEEIECELPAHTSLQVSVFRESSPSNAFTQHTFMTKRKNLHFKEEILLANKMNFLNEINKFKPTSIMLETNNKTELEDNSSDFTSISALIISQNEKILLNNNIDFEKKDINKEDLSKNKHNMIKPISQIEKNARVIQWIHGCIVNNNNNKNTAI